MEHNIQEFVENEFYFLHSHPELSYQEFETTKRLKKALESFSINILPYNLETGLVAQIGQGKPSIALRADIDALPIQEKTSLSYKSLNDGVMHACGHDSHAAALLGAAILLKQNEDKLKGAVRLIFQPAEEAPGGARKILEAGALDGIKAIYGIHSAYEHEVGEVSIAIGPDHAAVERFYIELKGKGVHAAHPELGNDVIVALSQIVSAAQTIVSRNLSPTTSNVVSITRISAGNTWNVIPEKAIVEGTIRTYTKETRQIAKDRFEQIVKGIGTAFNLEVNLIWKVELPPTDNDEKLAKFAQNIAKADGFKLVEGEKSLGGEDFSIYQESVKGSFILFGTGKGAPAHNPQFKVDKRAIYPMSKYLAHLATAYLEKHHD